MCLTAKRTRKGRGGERKRERERERENLCKQGGAGEGYFEDAVGYKGELRCERETLVNLKGKEHSVRQHGNCSAEISTSVNSQQKPSPRCLKVGHEACRRRDQGGSKAGQRQDRIKTSACVSSPTGMAVTAVSICSTMSKMSPGALVYQHPCSNDNVRDVHGRDQGWT